MFVYKHTETTEYVEILAYVLEKYELYGWITPEFLRLKMQGIIFIYI